MKYVLQKQNFNNTTKMIKQNKEGYLKYLTRNLDQ